MDGVVDEVMEVWSFPDTKRAVLKAIRAAVGVAGVRSEVRVLDRLATMRQPLLIVWGRQDRIIPVHPSTTPVWSAVPCRAPVFTSSTVADTGPSSSVRRSSTRRCWSSVPRPALDVNLETQSPKEPLNKGTRLDPTHPPRAVLYLGEPACSRQASPRPPLPEGYFPLDSLDKNLFRTSLIQLARVHDVAGVEDGLDGFGDVEALAHLPGQEMG